jgi:MFS family permease
MNGPWEGAAVESRVADLRAALADSRFRRLLSVRLVGQFGDGALNAGLAAFVLFSPERQSTAAAVAASFAVLLLPYSLIGPFAGVFLDRWSRRQTLLVANCGRAIGAVGLAAIVAAGVADLRLGVAALVVIGANRFILAALQASVPHTVDRQYLIGANAVGPTIGTFASFLGGGAAIGLRLLLGSDDSASGVVVLLAAGTYALAGLLALTMNRTLLGPDQPVLLRLREAVTDVLRGLGEGVEHVWQRPAARDALAVMTGSRAMYGLVTVQGVLLFRATFNDVDDVDAGIASLGAAAGMAGLGILIAALVTPRGVRRCGPGRWTGAVLAIAAAAIVFGVLPLAQVPLILAAAPVAFAVQSTKIVVDSTLQRVCADSFLGRVFSIYDLLFNLALVGAAVAAALVLPDSGVDRVIPTIAAIGFAALAFWYPRTDATTAPSRPT